MPLSCTTARRRKPGRSRRGSSRSSRRAAARELHPAPGQELAWQPLSGLAELALVPDLPELLPRVLAPGEPVFAVERYDGGSGLRSVAFSEEPA